MELYATDFAVRVRAGAAWVELGEPALLRLGSAADDERGRQPPRRIAPVVVAIVSALPDERLRWVQSKSDSAAVRSAAATEIARRELWEAIPALIDQLADADPEVRWSAVRALRTMAGRCFDVEPTCPAPTWLALVERERHWWRAEGTTRRTTPGLTSSRANAVGDGG